MIAADYGILDNLLHNIDVGSFFFINFSQYIRFPLHKMTNHQ